MNSELLQKYIAGHATEDETRRVVEWMQASPENMREYRAQRKLHDIALWRAEESRQSVWRRLTWRRVVWEFAKIAAVFVLVFLGVRYWEDRQSVGDKPLQSIYVPAGQRAELMLADGTKVWLNSRSTLTFPGEFKGDMRNVTLDGEGYFAVTHNPEQPFIVKTSKWDVRVLGTEFNVKAYAQDSIWKVALLKGSVEIVRPKYGNIKLEPDTRICLTDGKLVKARIEHHDYFQWREGLLCFHNISVRDMIEKLKLYYGVDILVNNKRILQNHYTGKFRTKDGVEHVLRVLQLNNYFTYSIDEETNVITIN